MITIRGEAAGAKPGAALQTETILICAATRWETKPIVRRLDLVSDRADAFFGRAGELPVRLLQTGMGGENVARALAALPEPKNFSCVISAGFAGALDTTTKPGHIIADMPEDRAAWHDLALSCARKSGVDLRLGAVVSSARVATPAQKKALGRSCGACAVDMETQALRQWAQDRGIPFLALRVILDGVEDELPLGDDFASIMGFVAANLGRLGRLASLGLRQRRAIGDLARFLREFLPCL